MACLELLLAWYCGSAVTRSMQNSSGSRVTHLVVLHRSGALSRSYHQLRFYCNTFKRAEVGKIVDWP
jgi:hypothetical protein